MPPKSQPVKDFQVFARWRPLPASKATSSPVSLQHTTSQQGPRYSISITKTSSSCKPEKWSSGPSFTHVFSVENDNNDVYQRVVAPTLPNVLSGSTCNFFAYGHSGSGKTHTIIGYDYDCEDARRLGLCLATARDIFNSLNAINAEEIGVDEKQRHGKAVEEEKELGVAVSIYQVRGKFAYDLLNRSGECHIREGPDGATHIRGETETLPGGKIRVRPIRAIPCWDLDSLRSTLLAGLANREQGSSSTHDESSRTHAIIELEIVNRCVLQKRDALIERESELVPVGKRATDVYIAEQLASLIKQDDGTIVENPERPINQAIIDEAEAEKKVCEDAVKYAEREVEACFEGTAQKCLGGKYVFVDLAGAEYFSPRLSSTSAASSSTNKQPKQTLAEQQQGRQINTDLFALKEVIRARAQGKSRIPYRASPLTMVLRSCFEGVGVQKGKAISAEREGGSSAMIVTLSPERDMEAATRNSLKYGGLVGSAGN